MIDDPGTTFNNGPADQKPFSLADLDLLATIMDDPNLPSLEGDATNGLCDPAALRFLKAKLPACDPPLPTLPACRAFGIPVYVHEFIAKGTLVAMKDGVPVAMIGGLLLPEDQ